MVSLLDSQAHAHFRAAWGRSLSSTHDSVSVPVDLGSFSVNHSSLTVLPSKLVPVWPRLKVRFLLRKVTEPETSAPFWTISQSAPLPASPTQDDRASSGAITCRGLSSEAALWAVLAFSFTSEKLPLFGAALQSLIFP